MRRLLAAAALLMTVAGVAQAQQMPAKSNVLSVQPLNLLAEAVSLEFERAVSPTMTLGVGGSYWNADVDGDVEPNDVGGSASGDVSYKSGDVKLRYYPGALPFRGFSFGVQGGFTSITGDVTDDATGERAEGTVSGPTVGIGLDYNWLLGKSQTFYIGLGLGAKRLFVDEDEVDEAIVAYPTARISVGFAF